jgi:hypothetical protein
MFTLVLAGLLAYSPATTPSQDPVLTYLESTFSTDPAPALAVASPDSDAARFAVHMSAVAEAVISAGDPWLPPAVLPQTGGDYQVCYAVQCIVFADFTTDETGLLTGFTADGTNPAQFLGSQAEEPVTSGPVSARVLSSYVSGPALVVTVEISTDEDVILSLSEAVYIGPDGRQVSTSPDGTHFPAELFAGANTVTVVTFPGADLGGTLRFDTLSADRTNQYPLILDVPVATATEPATTVASTTA